LCSLIFGVIPFAKGRGGGEGRDAQEKEGGGGRREEIHESSSS